MRNAAGFSAAQSELPLLRNRNFVPVTVIVQKMLEDRFRGRVWAFLGSLTSAMMPLAYLTGGFLARVTRLYVIFLVGGVIIISVLIVLSRLKELQKA